jgi:pyridoxine 4-dehydrogenase
LNLQLLNRYFTKYPEDASRVILSVKGCFDLATLTPEGSPEGVRKSVDNVLRILDGKKKVDIFECARVDRNTPIETTISTLAEYVKEGKIGGIGLSEASAQTIRKAHTVHPIAAVEVEFSLWSTEIKSNGVASTCAELNIPIVAYSPLGRGFFTGEIKSPNDFPEGDFRRHMDRFQPDVFYKNMELVDKVKAIAERKGCTPAQLALGWVRAHNGKEGMPTIIPIPGATTAERIVENMKEVELSEADMAEIDKMLESITVLGGRYFEKAEDSLFV